MNSHGTPNSGDLSRVNAFVYVRVGVRVESKGASMGRTRINRESDEKVRQGRGAIESECKKT